MDKESFFISQFGSKKIGDDGAVLGEWVYSKDIFAQDVHFKLQWLSLEQIARKSMLVNISDAIAMNAKPKYALIGVVIPSSFTSGELARLGREFEKVAQEYGFEIIGGDTTSGEKLVISITIISHTKKPIYRKGLRKGDFVAYTGRLGESKKHLNRLLRGGSVSKNSKFIAPKLRDKFFYKASKFVTSAMDISDGLGKDLSRLCKLNNLDVRCTCTHMCSGEEYEMLFSFKPRDFGAIRRIAQKYKTEITVLSRARRGRFKNPCKEHHF